MGVQLMMVDERAEGLFDRAWSHAGYGNWPFPKAYNPSDEERARIRYGALRTEASAAQIVSETPHYHLPYIDAPHLKTQPSHAFNHGVFKRVPYVAGANSYDGAGTMQGAGYTVERFLALVDSPEIRAAYAGDFAVSDEQAAQRIFGDLRYFRSSVWTAFYAIGWAFYYDARGGNAPGAYHGQQLNDMFAGTPSPFRAAFVRFAKTGDPGWTKLQDDGIARFSPEMGQVSSADFKARMEALSAVFDDRKAQTTP
jgi:hypothetical protein